MNGNVNNNHNGPNNGPGAYSLLHRGETIDSPNIPWLERFNAFLDRAGGEPHWPDVRIGNGGGWEVSLQVNGHAVGGFIGRGQQKRDAKIDLVRQLQGNENDLFFRPLRPQYQVIQPVDGNQAPNGNPNAGGAPPDGGSSDEGSTSNDGTPAPE
ncbi:unnamed protein product [Rhizoctonia solani]|uniref:Uncharacterized protein n=1 Tax=Rhizoctonia solani TaxID=456999 RepID=A0A8H3E046_9AGAM|nr:unnamed protein product [Rhizoctonia solani]